MSQKPVVTIIPGLRSPYDKSAGGMVHFGRMLDKIRLHAAGKLPPLWVEAKGSPRGFDGFCCQFLQISYAELEAETLKGRSDEEMVQWAFTRGRKPTEFDLMMWNGFLSKRGWKDEVAHRLEFRLQESGFPPNAALTMFDFIELDEGRQPQLK